jgi:hypothetical protein
MSHSQRAALTPEDVIQTYPALTTSVGTLANWRSRKRGPKFYKLARRVVYRSKDIEDYLFRNPILTIDSV